MRARIAGGHDDLEGFEVSLLIHLLACMVHVLRWSLIHRKYNCGSYNPVQWIKSIAGCYEAAKDSDEDPWTTVPLTGEKEMWPIFRLILALLKACVDQGLLTVLNDVGHEDAMDASEFEHLITLLGRPIELPKIQHELSNPPAHVQRSKAGPEDGVSTAVLLMRLRAVGTHVAYTELLLVYVDNWPISGENPVHILVLR